MIKPTVPWKLWWMTNNRCLSVFIPTRNIYLCNIFYFFSREFHPPKRIWFASAVVSFIFQTASHSREQAQILHYNMFGFSIKYYKTHPRYIIQRRRINIIYGTVHSGGGCSCPVRTRYFSIFRCNNRSRWSVIMRIVHKSPPFVHT